MTAGTKAGTNAGMEAGEMDFSLRYTFTYRMKPTNVRLHLLRDPLSGTNWIFVAA